MHFSDEYCEYVLDPNAHIEAINVQQYGDPYLQNYVQMQPLNNAENYHNLAPMQNLPPPPVQPSTSRHLNCSPDQVNEYANNSVKNSTKRQTVWGVNVFRDWLKETGRDIQFEQMSKEVLADNLRVFYASARKQDRTPYQKQTLVNIRSGINRHLSFPPYNRPWDLMNDNEFKPANKVFVGKLRKQKEDGLDTSTHYEAITKEHLEQIYTNYFDDHWDNDPRVLLHKVYFDVSYYLGRRGTEGLRKLKKSSFQVLKTPDGKEYLQLTYNESTKKSQGDDNNPKDIKSIVLEQPGSRRCPVTSFKLYISKLCEEIEDFFQQPHPFYNVHQPKWYKACPVGVNTIGKFLSTISKAAGLSTIYTNHSIRATTVNAMKEGDFDLYDITNVTKHKSIESLKSYLTKPDLAKKASYSDHLFNYTNPQEKGNDDAAEESDPNDFEDFEPPPPKKSKSITTSGKGKGKGKSSKSKVTCKPNTESNKENKKNDDNEDASNLELVPYEAPNSSVDNAIQNTQNNYNNNLKQNPVGMFVGANLTNCTININIPK